jgi:3-oxoacyl-[acyl-carrier protein] reductase
MDLGLAGKQVLITGGSKGIGLALAHAFAAEGANIIIVSRDKATLESAAGEVARRHNAGTTAHAADLADAAQRRRLHEAFPDVDILVNNAGAIPGGNLEEIDEARWRQAWDLKVFGYVNLARAYFAQMKSRRRGVIVNVIGSAGEKLDAAYIAGSTGNASLMAFTRALGAAAPDAGLRVVGINPGPVATDRLVTLLKKRAQDRLGDAGRWQELVKPMPFGRAAKPEEIAAMVAFLASDLSGYTTGTVITIDGGAAHRGAVM